MIGLSRELKHAAALRAVKIVMQRIRVRPRWFKHCEIRLANEHPARLKGVVLQFSGGDGRLELSQDSSQIGRKSDFYLDVERVA